jgi:Xaa-Pro aminopeptidase
MIIRRQRLERAFQTMQKHNVDMWIIYGRDLLHCGEPMLSYLLTFKMSGPVALVLTKDGNSIITNSKMELEEIQSMRIFTDVIENKDGIEGVKKFIADYVHEKKPKNIALNYSKLDPTSDGLSFSGYLLLKEALDIAKFTGEIISSQQLMKFVRGNRSKEEVERIRYAVQESMKIYDEARPQLRKGMSGMDVQRLFQCINDKKGYGYSWDKYGNPFVSIGSRSSYLCKRPPDDIFIEAGDVVNVDFGIIVNGSASDNQRTFYALREGESEPPEEVVKAFETIGELNRVLATHMKTGEKADSILPYGNDVLRKNGYSERTGGFGHEIGFYAHDGVLTAGGKSGAPDIDITFIEGMTFTLEPAIITPYGRICREEVVAVTDTGGEILSTIQDTIWLIS